MCSSRQAFERASRFAVRLSSLLCSSMWRDGIDCTFQNSCEYSLWCCIAVKEGAKAGTQY